jgi:threonine/homoserine/homoserine lactone efflux protein
MTEAVIKGAIYALALILSVGPTIFAILKYSITYGHRAGMSYVLGVFLSDALYVLLANVAANLLSVAQQYQKPIGVVGSSILIAMGLVGFFKKLSVQRGSDTVAPIGSLGFIKIFANGFLINTLNPAVILAWTTMTLTVSSESTSYRMVLFTTTLALAISGDLLKVFMANRVRKLLTPRNIIYLQRTSAVILFALGLIVFIKTIFFTK